ncbi:MAG: SMC-Scp complex subunit ScpB [Planctomycetaceae bacterium]|nr:SMC-Scp complex subunit ScpB [Planctomycetaceae bacterium]
MSSERRKTGTFRTRTPHPQPQKTVSFLPRRPEEFRLSSPSAFPPEVSLPERSELMQTLEALLFITREPLSSRRLAQFAQIEDLSEIHDAIRTLNHLYDAGHSAFRILEFARGFQLRTRPQFTPWLRLLCRQGGVENQENPEIRLSPPAMETLAIIAYRDAADTPATRAEIEAIRGVQSCIEILRQLLGKDLIRIAGRSSELGRPRLYRTTKKFLEVFGLKTLRQLPKIEFESAPPAESVGTSPGPAVSSSSIKKSSQNS